MCFRILLVFTLLRLAHAEDIIPVPRPSFIYKDVTEVDFEGQEVSGEIIKPGMSYITSRAGLQDLCDQILEESTQKSLELKERMSKSPDDRKLDKKATEQMDRFAAKYLYCTYWKRTEKKNCTGPYREFTYKKVDYCNERQIYLDNDVAGHQVNVDSLLDLYRTENELCLVHDKSRYAFGIVPRYSLEIVQTALSEAMLKKSLRGGGAEILYSQIVDSARFKNKKYSMTTREFLNYLRELNESGAPCEDFLFDKKKKLWGPAEVKAYILKRLAEEELSFQSDGPNPRSSDRKTSPRPEPVVGG